MPIDRYFDKFPVISYSNTQIVDITKRVAVLEKVSKNPFVYYPYDISDSERADQLASRYYEDSFKSWIVYLSNKIVDPYHEWYLDQQQFNDLLVKKYGTTVNAYEKTVFYRNDWINSENITISRYDSLTPKLRNYWKPVYGTANNIISYKRKEYDWTINTNKIVSYTVSNTSFVNNEICDIVFDIRNTGKAQILYTTGNTIYVQHTVGTTLSNTTVTITANSYIYGNESNVNTSFSNSTLIVANLSDEEEIYWKAIKCYDFENDKNEFNKTVRVIDNRFTDTVVRNFETLMEE